jgi:excisionase family DNA binding protein
MSKPDILTTKQAAQELGLTERRIRALIGAGRLKADRFGQRSHAIRRSDLDAVRVRKPGRPQR